MTVSKQPDPETTEPTQDGPSSETAGETRSLGLMDGGGSHGNVLRLQPPLSPGRAAIGRAVGALEPGLRAAE